MCHFSFLEKLRKKSEKTIEFDDFTIDSMLTAHAQAQVLGRHVAIGMVRTTIRRRHGAKLGLQIFQSKSSGLRGVSISAVDKGSASAEAGLRVNDVVVMIGVSTCGERRKKDNVGIYRGTHSP